MVSAERGQLIPMTTHYNAGKSIIRGSHMLGRLFKGIKAGLAKTRGVFTAACSTYFAVKGGSIRRSSTNWRSGFTSRMLARRHAHSSWIAFGKRSATKK